MVGKKLEHWTHLVVRYRGMQHERKRIERLLTQTEAEMNTETDILDYLAEAEKHKQSR